MQMLYADRRDAGRTLARELSGYAHRADVLVLGLPRGGVPVAFEVAQALDVPLDLMIVRKLGYPGQEELAMGAVASGGGVVLNRELLDQVDMEREIIEEVLERERLELARRETRYRGSKPPIELRGKTVILVDDGLATGSTMLAAVRAVKDRDPARIIVAVPVAPADTVEMFEREVDEVVCPATPSPFAGVGRWYDDFRQTSDDEVIELLQRATLSRSEPSTRDV